ncbi:MAG: outer membrane beta-barrel protein [Muribaculaceae bacterium]|nr:outer membrane beta-barrel protein [Muribaculaceae bacterium]
MMKRFVSIMTAAIFAVLVLNAQEYRFEVGPTLGIAGYLGDINKSNMWKHPGLAGGAMLRYVANSRWAFKGNLTYGRVSGSTRDSGMKWPEGYGAEFKSNIYDLSATAEFNFFHFGAGPRYKNYKRLSPYMVVGLGTVFSTTGKGNTGFCLTLPMGAGVKFKLKERMNIGFEFTMRKDFGDKLDNVSDPYGIKHGFAKNTDWHSFALFTVTYEFSKRCTKCHYVE